MKPQQIKLTGGAHKSRYGEGVCQCGCGEPAPLAQKGNRAKGQVIGAPLRFISGHNARRNSQYYLSKLREQDCGHDTPCWLWTGAVDRKGYGRAQYQGVHMGAHRVMCLLLRGSIPSGLQLHHECTNKLCCNPDHLKAVSNAENNRLKPGKLSLEIVSAIRASTDTHAAIAEKFGVSRQHVGDIKKGAKWAV